MFMTGVSPNDRYEWFCWGPQPQAGGGVGPGKPHPLNPDPQPQAG